LRERLRLDEKPAPMRWRIPGRYFGLAASIAAVAVMSFVLGHYSWGYAKPLANRDDDLSRQVVASHIRSLQVEHLTDVASSDRHTVKPWFKGKVDFAPVVVDFSDHGFPLVGGRLDYFDGHPAAAVVYNRRKHVINLFLWRADYCAEMPVQMEERQGYHLARWAQADFNFVAISDLAEGELREFADIVRESHK
jgi:anti-sigma factor RsiW